MTNKPPTLVQGGVGGGFQSSPLIHKTQPCPQGSHPMLPSVLASQIQHGVEDFLRTTFSISTPFFHGLMDRFLEKGDLFHGPYLSINLPFIQGTNSEPFPDLHLGFTPYLHQEKAFANLTGPSPKSSLIATGTGSGKTECFLYPILQHCFTHRHERGIKAILIYPMNALATDQAARVARAIWRDDTLRGKVTAGLFVGQQEQHPTKVMTEEGIVTDKDTMRLAPPDILLTNYKMLDYLLLRPKDQGLWQHNDPESLSFLVVDELHTFDGAQGTDMACLIRRLKDRLGTPEKHLTCVGTSATLGSETSGTRLLEYAEKIFGEPFDGQSLITEKRISAGEFLGDSIVAHVDIPGPGDVERMDPDRFDDIPSYIRTQYRLWFDQPADPAAFERAEFRTDLAEKLKQHLFFQNLLKELKGRIVPADDLLASLQQYPPRMGSSDRGFQHLLLSSLLALISEARIWRPESEEQKKVRSSTGLPRQTLPFLHVRLQHWMRELGRMVVSLNIKPTLAFSADLTEEQQKCHLPVVHCRECGVMGWVGTKAAHETCVGTKLKDIYHQFFAKKPTKLIELFPDDQDNAQRGLDGYTHYFCTGCHGLFPRKASERCPMCGCTTVLPVFVPSESSHNCPYCGAHNALTLLGSRAASLTSVMIAQLYSSTFNDDKKLITFSDNVQDAAHRAGFFKARTFRFNLRTAMQQCLQSCSEDPVLTDFPEIFRKFWSDRFDLPRYAATFLAPNMEWFADYAALTNHGHLPPKSDLLRQIHQRLTWEIITEYSFSARIGRTLERTGSSIAFVDPDLLQTVIREIGETLRNEMEDLRETSDTVIAPFVCGFLTHLKNMGAVMQPILKGYIDQGGKEYMLSQSKIPWMPNIGPRTRAPRLLTNRVDLARFEPLLKSSHSTWCERWAWKHFYRLKMTGSSLTNTLYALCLKVLVRHGVIEEMVPGKDHTKNGHAGYKHGMVWALRPESLRIGTDVVQMRCSTCGHMISVAGPQASCWDGCHCLRIPCEGVYTPLPETRDYYGQLYSRGDVERLFAKEHTGLLDRNDREKVEREFKRMDHRHPWDANLLSCTPTLEMGIDIGNLSSTIQCSVPPSQSNYLQRIGRSGRKDGNGLNLTIANMRPHDLYFFADPLAMLAGNVEPPGVFLDASAVLERQLTAFCMGRWVIQGIPPKGLPHRMGTVLDTVDGQTGKGFPYNFIRFVETHQSELLEGFLTAFANSLSDQAVKHLQRFIHGDEKQAGLDYNILEGLLRLAKERKSLRARMNRLRKFIKKKESDPARDKKYQDQLRELRLEKSGLQELVKNLNSRDIFNFFTDEGLLPNYAFPEEGVTLHSIIYRRKKEVVEGESKYDTVAFDYERAAGTALQELAPDNRFYAGGRKVTIDQVDLSVSGVEVWRLCSECSYSEMVGVRDEQTTCPRCGSPMWADEGRKRQMLKMRQVFAATADNKSRISDDKDQRDPQFYIRQMLVDYDPAHITDAYRIESEDTIFGFAFLSKALFREVNFGPRRDDGDEFSVAGEEVPRYGFHICRHCGKVQPENSKKTPVHTLSCTARNPQSPKNVLECVYLYRDFSSEAIKILLPISGFAGSETKLHSFIAALHLGLKLQFGGSIAHLQTTIHSEPIPDTTLRKQYLIIYDTVPGGTGYLKQLMRSDMLFHVLELALKKLISCPCGQQEDKDGCYQCLYGYRNSRDMDTISRKTAMDILSGIVREKHTLIQVKNLKNIPMGVLFDSELEARFVEAIRRLCHSETRPVNIKKQLVNGRPGHFLHIGNQRWTIEQQVELGPSDGVQVRSRADFVFYPAREGSKVKPVVVFTDGFAFHKNRIGQDMAQRMAIVRSGRFHVWSVTFKDVARAFKNTPEFFDDWFAPHDDFTETKLESLWAGYAMKAGERLDGCTSFDLLVRYLSAPEPSFWQRTAFIYALGFIQASMDQEARISWKEHLKKSLPEHLTADLTEIPDPVLLGTWDKEEHCPLTFRCAIAQDALRTLKTGDAGIAAVLNDAAPMPEQQSFERHWVSFLRTFNIFQFLKRSLAVTTSGVKDHQYASIPEFSKPQQGMHPEDIPDDVPDTEDDHQAWADALDLISPGFEKVVRALCAAKVKAPEVGFELLKDGMVLAEAELAWEDEKMVILSEEDVVTLNVFQESGWTVYGQQEALEQMDDVVHRLMQVHTMPEPEKDGTGYTTRP